MQNDGAPRPRRASKRAKSLTTYQRNAFCSGNIRTAQICGHGNRDAYSVPESERSSDSFFSPLVSRPWSGLSGCHAPHSWGHSSQGIPDHFTTDPGQPSVKYWKEVSNLLRLWHLRGENLYHKPRHTRLAFRRLEGFRCTLSRKAVKYEPCGYECHPDGICW